MILLLDNYDSFTYNLKDYLEQLGEEVEVVRNDEISANEVLAKNPKGIVIAPGPGRPEQAGICMDLLNKAAGQVPVLGICLGMQAIGLLYGAKLKRCAYPMHGKVSRIQLEQNELFDGLPKTIEVCRYHSLVLDQVETSNLRVLAVSSVGECMAIEHSKDNMFGLQFHPEAILTQFGLEMLSNWLKRITLQSKTTAV